MPDEVTTKKTHLKKVAKVFLWIFVGVAILITVFLGFGNILKFANYHDFYFSSKVHGLNPIKNGYVNQGLHYLNDSNEFLISAYKTNKPSVIYTVSSENKVNECSLMYTDFNYSSKELSCHAGGVTRVGNEVLLTGDNKVFFFNLNDVKNNRLAIAHKIVETELRCDYISVCDNELFIGEFSSNTFSQRNHPYLNTDNYTTHAIVESFDLGEFCNTPDEEIAKAKAVYAIRDLAQGFAKTPEGQFIIDTSFGIMPSYLCNYTVPTIPDGLDANSVPVYYLDSRYLLKERIIIPGCEDIEVYDGRVYFASETPASKFGYYGRFFNFNGIYSMPANV